jgi:lysozyme
MADITNSIKIATEFVKKWEGYMKKLPNGDCQAYWDSLGKVWTIGWGSTYYKDGSRIKEGDTLTLQQASDLLNYELSSKESEIRKFINYQNLTDNQYAALISIAFNAGAGGLKSSKITSAVNGGQDVSSVSKIISDSIVTAKGVFVQGLKNRRIDEAKLYDGSYNALYSYYLRNKSNVTLVGVGVLLLALSSYLYIKIKK